MNVKITQNSKKWVAFATSKSLDECLEFCRKKAGKQCEVITDDEARFIMRDRVKMYGFTLFKEVR